MQIKERIVLLVASKVAEKYMTGTNGIVAVGHDGKKVIVYASNKKVTRKLVLKKMDGIKITVKEMTVNPAGMTDLVA